MISFFKNKEKNEPQDSSYSKIAALLIHAAKIDEAYEKKEEDIIKETLIDLGASISEIDKIPAFTIDASWRINGIFKPYIKEQERTISNIWGHAVEQPTAGIVTFNYANQVYELESNIESGKLAVIFKDGTTGNETYSGGRQLYLSKPDKDGEVILDFNKSFNFPCAFNDFTTCPVPPEKNRLPFRIIAGEKRYIKI